MLTEFRRAPFVISKHSNSVHGRAGSSEVEDMNLRRIRHSDPKRKNAFRTIRESPHLFKKKKFRDISTNKKEVLAPTKIPHRCLFQPNLQIH